MIDWIDVKDDLPQEGQPVIVFTDDFDFASLCSDGQWYLWGHEFEVDGWIPEWAVTHWCELNEPEGEFDD